MSLNLLMKSNVNKKFNNIGSCEDIEKIFKYLNKEDIELEEIVLTIDGEECSLSKKIFDCLSKDERFTFIYLRIDDLSLDFNHANILIYDEMENMIFRFDPNGYGYFPIVDDFLKEYLYKEVIDYENLGAYWGYERSKIIKKIKESIKLSKTKEEVEDWEKHLEEYKNLENEELLMGFQYISSYENNIKVRNNGVCAYWCMCLCLLVKYNEKYLENHDIVEFTVDLLDSIDKNFNSYVEYIYNFVSLIKKN